MNFPASIVSHRCQRTLAQVIQYEGIGLHTGQTVRMRLLPADCNTGVLFSRTDLPGCPLIPALITSVCEASERCTAIGQSGLRIYTVEHLLAALYAHQIDNVLIELSTIEPPIGNGSSDVFVSLLQRAGAIEQSAPRKCLQLHQPLYWSEGNSSIVALPSSNYQVSYTLSYPNCAPLQAQFRSFIIDSKTFNEEISSCRTFCLYEEISVLTDRGLIKGGSLDNAVVICGEAVLSKNGLFFRDEMVRHKILDLIGDLALVGSDLQAHLIAVRAGHASHCAMAGLLHKLLT